MAAARRHRYRRPARQTGTRSPRRRLLVICEGSVTERSYIRGFERWLLLHFRECPGMRERQELQRMMRQYLPGYRKRLDFAAVQNGGVAAAERARRLDAEARQVGEPGRNPTTSVYRLTDSILRTDEEPGHTCDPEQ